MTLFDALLSPAFQRVVRIAVTCGLIAVLWSAVDGPEVLRGLSQAQPGWLAGALLVLILQTILSAARWKITARQLGQNLQLGYAVKEYIISQSVNQAAPGAVLGDVARAVRTQGKIGLPTAGLAVALERFAGQIAMFLTLAAAFVVTSLKPGGIDLTSTYAGAVGLGLAVVTLAGITLAIFSGQTDRGLRKWVGLAHRGLLAPAVLPSQIVLGFAITACNLAAFGLSALAAGVALSLPTLLTLVPIILFSMLIPLTVSGWGVREGTAALLLPMVGIAATDAVTASVLFGIALLLSVLPGFFLMVMR